MTTHDFISNDGLFKLKFPLDWTYELADKQTYRFTPKNGIGDFNISAFHALIPTKKKGTIAPSILIPMQI